MMIKISVNDVDVCIYIFRNIKTLSYVLFLFCVCLIYQSWMFVLNSDKSCIWIAFFIFLHRRYNKRTPYLLHHYPCKLTILMIIRTFRFYQGNLDIENIHFAIKTLLHKEMNSIFSFSIYMLQHYSSAYIYLLLVKEYTTYVKFDTGSEI
jgi:hypothetical protein